MWNEIVPATFGNEFDVCDVPCDISVHYLSVINIPHFYFLCVYLESILDSFQIATRVLLDGLQSEIHGQRVRIALAQATNMT